MSEENKESENTGENDVPTMQEQFESLEIPPGIDPKLLELWLERERETLEKDNQPHKPKKVRQERKLSVLFAAYIGIVVMCFTILLGFLQEKEPAEILVNTCKAFLVYSAAGFVFGWVADYCVSESVETLLREIVRRSHSVSEEQPQTNTEI